MVTTATATPTTTYEKGQLYQLPLTDLQADPKQPRKYLDPQALQDLSDSIAQHGVLTPILFRVEISEETGGHDAASRPPVSSPPPASLFIVAGERRCEAAKTAGLTTIPAILVEDKTGEIALVENLLRQDLTAVEEAEALDRLMKEESYTQEQLGAIVGKARTTIGDILTLTRLPQAIRDECRGALTVTRKTLIEIARKKQERAMLTAWNKYKEKAAKEAAGKQPRFKTPDNAEEAVKWLERAIAKLDALDTAAWSEDEKSAFNQTLLVLEESIQGRLNALESGGGAPERIRAV